MFFSYPRITTISLKWEALFPKAYHYTSTKQSLPSPGANIYNAGKPLNFLHQAVKHLLRLLSSISSTLSKDSQCQKMVRSSLQRRPTDQDPNQTHHHSHLLNQISRQAMPCEWHNNHSVPASTHRPHDQPALRPHLETSMCHRHLGAEIHGTRIVHWGAGNGSLGLCVPF